MRTLRLFLYFVLGLTLGAYVTLAQAETQPSTPVPYQTVSATGWKIGSGTTYFSDASTACNNYRTDLTVTASLGALYKGSSASCTRSTYTIQVAKVCPSGNSPYLDAYPETQSAPTSCFKAGSGHICPDSTWTLSSDGTTCTRPDTCVAEQLGDAWYKQGKEETSLANQDYCESGCVVRYAAFLDMSGASPDFYYDDKYIWKKYGKQRIAQTCSTGTAPPQGSTQSPSEPPKKPPCSEGEGVITTSGGKVMCVPKSTSPDQPTINKTNKTDTYPDGSTKTTNITQTCTGAGACSTTTTTTITGQGGSGGSGTPGQAGTPGTTTTTEDAEPSDKPDFCAKNPTMQICKGGIAEEGTQKNILDEVKKLSTAPSDTKFVSPEDYDSGMEGVDTDAKNALDKTYKDRQELMQTYFDKDTNAPKAADRKITEILAGWFEDVPMEGCEPPQFAVAGHELVLDSWCVQAEKISSIGAYALWFMTAIGMFTMITGGKEGT